MRAMGLEAADQVLVGWAAVDMAAGDPVSADLVGGEKERRRPKWLKSDARARQHPGPAHSMQ